MAEPAGELRGLGKVRGHPARWTALTCIVLAALFVFAVVEYSTVHWYPVLDDALTEIRVRLVWSRHPPLIGLPGRIGTAAHPGSHLGPISFFALWPVYRLLGANSWALQVSTASIHLLAVIATIALVHRRRRPALVVGIGTAFAVLIAFFGPIILTEPWNPYLPILWWVAFLVAVWSLTCGDWLAMPLAVIAGSMCMETHISYVGLVPGVALVGLAVAVVRYRGGGLEWSRVHTRSAVIAGLLGGLLWLPPVLDQLGHSPGNLGIAVSYFSNPPTPPIGFQRGLSLLLVHLNPWNLLTRRNVVTGSVVPGAVLLSVWGASAVMAAVRRVTELVLLDVVLATSLVLGLVSATRIFGPVSYYLVLWTWGLLALMCVAIGWTFGVLLDPSRARSVVLVGTTALLLTVWTTSRFIDDTSQRPLPSGPDQPLLARLVPATRRGLDDMARRSPGAQMYTMEWNDPLRLGGVGYALLNELRRKGYPVGATPNYGRFLPDQYIVAPQDAAGLLHVAWGDEIARLRARPGVTEIAHADPRTRTERALYAAYRRDALATLQAAGLGQLHGALGGNLFLAARDTRLPARVRADALAMVHLGEAVSVFYVPYARP